MDRIRREQSEREEKRPAQRARPAPNEGRDPVSRLHRAAGNQAVQAMVEGTANAVPARPTGARETPGLATGSRERAVARTGAVPTGVVQRQTSASAGSGESGSVKQQVESTTGARTDDYAVTASATLAGGQTLATTKNAIIRTGESDTTVSATVAEWGIRIRFHEALIMESRSWHGINCSIYSLKWDFEDQTIDAEWDTTMPFGGGALTGTGTQIEKGLGTAIEKNLPSRVREKGYNPYDDPKLPEDLARLVENFGASPPEASDVRLEASLTFTEEVTKTYNGVRALVPGGTEVEAEMRLADGTAEPRVSAISLDFRTNGSGAKLQVPIGGTMFPAVWIQHVELHRGGEVVMKGDDYHLATEATVETVKLLAALARMNGMEPSDPRKIDLESRHEGLRQRIQAAIDDRLEPMLKEFVLRNRDQFPKVDLATLLGISG